MSPTTLGQRIDRVAVGHHLDQTLADEEHAERLDEGGNAQPDHDEAVDQADQPADHHPADDGERHRQRRGCHQLGADHRAESPRPSRPKGRTRRRRGESVWPMAMMPTNETTVRIARMLRLGKERRLEEVEEADDAGSGRRARRPRRRRARGPGARGATGPAQSGFGLPRCPCRQRSALSAGAAQDSWRNELIPASHRFTSQFADNGCASIMLL